MIPSTLLLDGLAGWCLWSLAHNLGHRWWHEDMRNGKQTFYAHGEREHHRLYDNSNLPGWAAKEDPDELFISFPARHVAMVAVLPVALWGWWRGWPGAASFGVFLYASMLLDHQLHKLFHRRERLNGLMGWLQGMHIVHHATHDRNYFFVSGAVWDVLFGTLSSPPLGGASPQKKTAPSLSTGSGT